MGTRLPTEVKAKIESFRCAACIRKLNLDPILYSSFCLHLFSMSSCLHSMFSMYCCLRMISTHVFLSSTVLLENLSLHYCTPFYKYLLTRARTDISNYNEYWSFNLFVLFSFTISVDSCNVFILINLLPVLASFSFNILYTWIFP